MNDDVVLKGTVPLRASKIPEEHSHSSALTIRRSGEVGIVGTSAVLDTDSHTIGALSALSEVVDLEVESRLGETVSVGNVVDRVDDIEGIHFGRGKVSCGRWSRARALGVDELARG